MVEGSVLSLSPSFQLYSDVPTAKGAGDFNMLGAFEMPENEISFIPEISDENEKKQPKLEDEEEKEHVEEEEQQEEEEEEEEFSFSCTNPDGSPISADDVFVNGQIRPIFPIFNRDLLFSGGYDGDLKSGVDSLSLRSPLRKLFVESASESASESDELEGVPAETYCEWSGAASGGAKAVETSPELCKKSNSTGFSKLWRFRDLVHRSNSDGKDAFVFLNHSSSSTSLAAANDKSRNETAKKNDKKVEQNDKKPPVAVAVAVKEAKAKANAKGKVKTASLSAHEKHYVSNRAKREGDKRKSYLPYRQDLVGFFTNVNGLSRNVHPF
ncbi:hypothetical protein ACJW31_03G148600 [Castanea mollissima]